MTESGALLTVENLRVRQDAACTLVGTRVDGNIFVENNAQLLADDVHVGGNIQAENAAKVNVYPGSFVGGSIQIVQSGEAAIQGVEIDSDLFFDDNNGLINAAYNTVGGNLQAFQNTGGVSVIGNVIDGNLQCLSNQPAPVGGGNIVQGNMEDQCAGFGGSAPPAPPMVPATLLSPADAAYQAFLPLMGR